MIEHFIEIIDGSETLDINGIRRGLPSGGSGGIGIKKIGRMKIFGDFEGMTPVIEKSSESKFIKFVISLGIRGFFRAFLDAETIRIDGVEIRRVRLEHDIRRVWGRLTPQRFFQVYTSEEGVALDFVGPVTPPTIVRGRT